MSNEDLKAQLEQSANSFLSAAFSLRSCSSSAFKFSLGTASHQLLQQLSTRDPHNLYCLV